jgi:glycosyltransferase involved in cell wall biosynthesis
MLRLQAGLNAAGVEATITCRVRTRRDSVPFPRTPRVASWLGGVTKRLGLNDVHCLGSFRLLHHPAYEAAEVIDLHCIQHGFFSYLALPRLSEHKPVVLTLHDMWPLTGHCHNSLDCERWRTGCGKCPYLDIAPPVRRDATHWEWALKAWIYGHSRLTIVSPSTWLTSLARESILGRFPIHHVPHGIDTNVFRPLDPQECRSVLGVPPGRKVLLFVVDNLDRHLKGGDLLVRALNQLPASLKRESVLLLLGSGGEAIARGVEIPVLRLGFVTGERFRVISYSAADLLIYPTRADNFPLIVLESLACGTPVVSFRLGGVPDLVRPGITGYLGKPGDADDLSKGIIELLENDTLRGFMREQCRKTVVDEYSLELYVERYLDVYAQAKRNHQS